MPVRYSSTVLLFTYVEASSYRNWVKIQPPTHTHKKNRQIDRNQEKPRRTPFNPTPATAALPLVLASILLLLLRLLLVLLLFLVPLLLVVGASLP